MTYAEIINMIAAALANSDDGALLDVGERLHDLLITDDEREALNALIDAGMDSIGRESA